MTHDPRLPTLEEVMNGSPFDIVDSPWGRIERWRASTLSTGSMGALSSVYDIVRADASAAASRADAEQARVALLQDVHKKLDALASRFDAIETEFETIKADAKRRAADEARKAKFDEAPVELPPDIHEYQTRTHPAPIESDATIAPSGNLHDLPPNTPDEEPKSELPEPPLETEADEDPGEEPGEPSEEFIFEPPEPGEPTTDARKPRGQGKVVPQPISVSLNER